MTSHLVACWIFQEVPKELSASEISIQVTRRHVPDDCNLHGHRNKIVSFTCPLQTCLALHSPLVTICTTSLTFTILRSVPTACLCVLCGSEIKQRLFPYTKLTDWFLGTFAKLRKAKIIFLRSVRPSVHLHGTTGRIYIKFHIHRYLKICRENSIFIKISQK